MLKPSGLIVLIIAILWIVYFLYGGGCDGSVPLLSQSLPQEPGSYLLINGSWEKTLPEESFSDDVVFSGDVRVSLVDFNNNALVLKLGSKLEWYRKYTPSELAYLNSGLFGAMQQGDMAGAQVWSLFGKEDYNSQNIRLYSKATWENPAAEPVAVATVISDKSDLSKGYTWYEFSAIPSPGQYVISYGSTPTIIGYIIVK